MSLSTKCWSHTDLKKKKKKQKLFLLQSLNSQSIAINRDFFIFFIFLFTYIKEYIQILLLHNS